MRVWGDIMEPGRNLVLNGPTCCTNHVVDYLTAKQYCTESCENRSPLHDPQRRPAPVAGPLRSLQFERGVPTRNQAVMFGSMDLPRVLTGS